MGEFARQEDGQAAVEFALVAVPFFAMVFAIIEMSLIFFGGQMLKSQVSNSARLILTGQQQKKDNSTWATDPAGMTAQQKADLRQAAFKKSLCDPTAAAAQRSMLSYLFDCTKIKVDVRAYSPGAGSSGFSRSNMNSPIVAGQVDPAFTPQYQLGNAGDVVVVRVLYEWPTLIINWPYRVASVVMDFSNLSNDKRLLMASAAFRNEPFQ